MGRQGESSREEAKRAILLLAADQKKRKRSEFIKELVDKNKKFSKNTVYKYLNKTVTDNLMKMEPGSREDSFRPDYSITEFGLKAVKRYEIDLLIGSFETEWLQVATAQLAQLLSKMKKVHLNPRWLLENQIFMYIPEKIERKVRLHLYMGPLQEKEMIDLIKYVKETGLIK